jgi:hypothetical protein
MGDPIKIYSLGKSGVIIDPNPLSPELPDDALANAQNAIHDPTTAHGGGLRKRPGFARFNAVYAGGSILGGIMAPVAGTGGAPTPASGSGPTGDPAGSGDGTGAPGGTSDGGTTTYAPPGATEFGGSGSSLLFGGARLLVIGFHDNTIPNTYGEGWYVTSKKMQDTANMVATPGPAAEPALTGLGEEYHKGSPSVVMPDGSLYYIAQHARTTVGGFTLRKTNGATDVAVATIPANAYYVSGSWQKDVTWMHKSVYQDVHPTDPHVGKILICVSDNSQTAGALTIHGRIFRFDPVTNSLTELNLTTTPPGLGVSGNEYTDTPSCCARVYDPIFAQYMFFWGTAPNIQDSGAKINVLSFEDGTPQYGTADYTGADQKYANITCMMSTNGTGAASASAPLLLAGTGCRTAGVVQRSQIMVRQPGTYVGSASAWVSHTIDIVGGDTLIDKNYYCSMVEFGDYFYTSWYNPGQVSRIYKFQVAESGGLYDLTNVSLSYASSGATGRVPYYLFVDDGVLYAIGSTGSGGAQRLHWTTDGSSWTDATANFPTTNAAAAMPIAFGLNQ